MKSVSNLFGSENMDFGVSSKTSDTDNLCVENNDVLNQPKLEAITYMNLISKAPNFIGLDISVNSTGWVKWENGVLTYGTYGLVNESELERRQEFKRFLLNLVGDGEFAFVGVEDTIGSCNYQVLKYLVQLNSIVDDMIYDKLLNIKEVKRIDNKVWKRILHELTKTKLSITKCKDKMLIKECMNDLGFKKEIIPDSRTFEGLKDMTNDSAVKQDVYDVLGISISLIVRDYLKLATKKTVKLKNDIRKGYQISQFADIFGAKEKAKSIASKKGREVCELDFLNIKRDLVYNFKKAVEQNGDEKIFVIQVPTNKVGVIAIDKDLNLDKDICYLIAYRNIKGVGKNV